MKAWYLGSVIHDDLVLSLEIPEEEGLKPFFLTLLQFPTTLLHAALQQSTALHSDIETTWWLRPTSAFPDPTSMLLSAC